MTREISDHRPVFVCLVVIALFYMSADLAVRTMMLDGVVYAAIAKHLSLGVGSFWYPPHFDAGAAAFYDHPPLGIWLQSLWFSLWGTAFWVENLYCAVLFVVLALLLARVYKAVGNSVVAWWPLLLLLLMPVTTRVIKSNMLETLVAVLVLLAVLAAWQGRRQRLWDVAVGLLCLAGALIKGPAALFPLVAPAAFAWVVDGSFSRAVLRTLITGIAFLVPFLLLLLYAPAQENLAAYLDQQLIASFNGARAPQHGRWYQLGQLGIQLGVVALLVVLLARVQGTRPRISREALALFAIGLAGSLPLLLSPRQYKTYLFPALPLFALAGALLLSPPVLARWRRVFTVLAGVVALAVIIRTTLLFGTPGNDAKLLADVEQIARAAQARGVAMVSFCELDDHLRVYLWRHHSVRSRVGSYAGLQVCSQGGKAEPVEDLSSGRRLWWRAFE